MKQVRTILSNLFILLTFINPLTAQNTQYGTGALQSNTTGNYNSAFGYQSLFKNTSGFSNTAIGSSSLQSNTTGYYNIAIGHNSLNFNTTGSSNTAIGSFSLQANTNGFSNTAIGTFSLQSNTTGYYNIAVGDLALIANTIGYNNTAVGYQALRSNTEGYDNVAMGANALRTNKFGGYNIAVGSGSLYWNNGADNTAIGTGCLYTNKLGSGNTGIGSGSLTQNTSGASNTTIGSESLVMNITGNFNTALGCRSDVSSGSLSYATAIGSNAIVNASNKIRLGSTFVTVIEGQVPYSFPSDGRFKDNISKDEVKGLEFIKLLQPVVYNFDTKKYQNFLTQNMPDSIRRKYMDNDFASSTAIRHSGFIAQEVEAAARKVGYDFDGVHTPENDNDNYSLSYSQFVVPLVQSVKELSQMVNELKKEVQMLKKVNNSFETSNIRLSDAGVSMLNQNMPNPFSEQTTINYNIPTDVQNAKIVFYNTTGQQIKFVRIQGTGQLKISAELKSGTYTYSLFINDKVVESKKMIKQ